MQVAVICQVMGDFKFSGPLFMQHVQPWHPPATVVTQTIIESTKARPYACRATPCPGWKSIAHSQGQRGASKQQLGA